MKLHCIICEEPLENMSDHYDDEVVHPLDGTQFRTYGHYGSTIHDPMNGDYLDIVICDKCLKNKLQHTYKGTSSDYVSASDLLNSL